MVLLTASDHRTGARAACRWPAASTRASSGEGAGSASARSAIWSAVIGVLMVLQLVGSSRASRASAARRWSPALWAPRLRSRHWGRVGKLPFMATATRTVSEVCESAKRASRELALASTETKNAALVRLAELLGARTDEILEANAEDLADERAAGLTEALRDRLALTRSGSRRWPRACARSPRCPTRSAR